MKDFSLTDGQILQQILEERGIKKGRLAIQLKKNRNTIGNMLKAETINDFKLIEIGRVIRFDMTSRFPRLLNNPEAVELREFVVGEEVQKTILQKDKEIEFLKEQIETLREIIESKNQLIKSKDDIIKDLRGN